MTELIIIIGALILLVGLVILINPEVILGPLRDNFKKPGIHIAAVIVRLLVGVLLIFQSSMSRFPVAVEILGWLSIVVALSLAVMGRHNFLRLMLWVLNLSKPHGRVSGVFAAAFGGLLIYAFI